MWVNYVSAVIYLARHFCMYVIRRNLAGCILDEYSETEGWTKSSPPTDQLIGLIFSARWKSGLRHG